MYSTHPERSWPTRFQYLCSKHVVGVKNVPWNSFWKVLVESVLNAELIWPYKSLSWTLEVEGDHYIYSIAATVVRLKCTCVRYNRNGQINDYVQTGIVWYVPYVSTLGVERINLSPYPDIQNKKDALLWIRNLKNSNILRTLACEKVGKRIILAPAVVLFNQKY